MRISFPVSDAVGYPFDERLRPESTGRGRLPGPGPMALIAPPSDRGRG